jgi:hypothetical protein
MRKTGFAVLILVLIAAGWSGLWLWGANEAGHRVDGWIKAEAVQGRIWTCPNRTLSGYPIAMAVTCSDPTFSGMALGQSVEGTVAEVKAEASLLHPRIIAISLRPPFAYKSADGQVDVHGTWTALDLAFGALPDIRTLVLAGRDVAVGGRLGQAGSQSGRATLLETQFTMTPDAADPLLDFDIAIGGMAMPPLDALLGGTQPIDATLKGRLDHADPAQARSPEEAMDLWRRSGGRVDLAASRLDRGASSVSASGTLGLDEAHRPQGRLDAQFVGLGPILSRYGISGNFAAAGALLSSLFGGGKHQDATPGALSLPVSLQNGRVGVGPIRTQIAIPPLY